MANPARPQDRDTAARGYSDADRERDTMTPAKQEARSAAKGRDEMVERERLLDDLAYWRGTLTAHRDVNAQGRAAGLQVLTQEGYEILIGVLDRATNALRSQLLPEDDLLIQLGVLLGEGVARMEQNQGGIWFSTDTMGTAPTSAAEVRRLYAEGREARGY